MNKIKYIYLILALILSNNSYAENVSACLSFLGKGNNIMQIVKASIDIGSTSAEFNDYVRKSKYTELQYKEIQSIRIGLANAPIQLSLIGTSAIFFTKINPENNNDILALFKTLMNNIGMYLQLNDLFIDYIGSDISIANDYKIKDILIRSRAILIDVRGKLNGCTL